MEEVRSRETVTRLWNMAESDDYNGPSMIPQEDL